MTRDFLDELGELALGSRLKRLSEQMMADAANVYRHFDLDVQPKWFTLLALLYQKDRVAVMEAADYLGLSQPAISQFTHQLVERGLVSTDPCERDSRRRLLMLTEKGRAQVERMQPMWRAVHRAAEQLCTELDNDFYHALRKCEQALSRKSLLQRTLEFYDEPTRS